jgi:diguanylate cyclase (GGDEF)-like protein/PAS domain S-box-containing protein
MGRTTNRNGHASSVAHGKAPRSLQASEGSCRSLFENMIDGYAHCRMLYDEQGKPDDFIYLYVNPAFERLSGLADVVGKRVSEVIPGIQQTNPELFEIYGRAALGGERARLETYVEALGLWFSIAVYSPCKDHFVSIFEDITQRKRIQDRLRLTQLSVDGAADLIHWIAPDGRLLYVSDSNCLRHGYSREEMLGLSIFDLDPSLSPLAWQQHWRRLKEHGSLSFETTHKTKAGEVFPLEVTANFVEQDGREYNFSYGRDISRRKELERSLRLTQCSVDKAADLIFWIGPDAELLYVNDATCQRLGYSRKELLTMSIMDIDPIAPDPWSAHWQELKEWGSLTFETSHRTKEGELFPIEVTATFVEQDGHEYNFAFARDISERKRSESESREAKEAAERANRELLQTQRSLERLARTDALTGTMNRRAILERLDEELARAGRYGTGLAIATIDIDHFKGVNDSIGHGAGDEVLREVVLRASEALRPYDGFGRVGGDEFLAIMPQVSTSQLTEALERVRLAIRSTPIAAAGHEVNLTVSIGATLSRGESTDELIRSADEALYQAKAEGRDRVVMGAGGRKGTRPCAGTG